MSKDDDVDLIKPKNKTLLMYLITVLFFIVISGYLGALAFNSNVLLKKYENTNSELKGKLVNVSAALNGTKSFLNAKSESFNSLTEQYNKLKKQYDSISDKNGHLKRDIELYIKTTHPKVPRVVAKSIAVNTISIAKKYSISPELIIGIMKVESSFNPQAVGSKTKYGHARGLMQVMPEWVKKLNLKSVYDLHDIDIGIETGVRVFLIHLEEEKGDISTGLYKYVNSDKGYVGQVYIAMGKFVAFRSTIDTKEMNVKTDIYDIHDKKSIQKKGEKPDGKKDNRKDT